MMSENDKDNRRHHLLSAENWVFWFSRFNNLCEINGWVTAAGVYATDPALVKQLELWLVRNIADSAINKLDCSKSPFDMVAGLQTAFGMGYFTAKEQIALLRKKIIFPPQDNSNEVYRQLNGQVRIIKGIGGNVSNEQLKELLIEGLNKKY